MNAETLIALTALRRAESGLGLKVTFPNGQVWTGYAKSAEQLAKWKASARCQAATHEPIGAAQ
jgi:hypothetical protein